MRKNRFSLLSANHLKKQKLAPKFMFIILESLKSSANELVNINDI